MSDNAVAAALAEPVAESTPVEAPAITVEPVGPTSTLLSGDAPAVVAEVPADAQPEPVAPTEAATPTAEPAAEPETPAEAPAPLAYEPFAFPEGLVVAPDDTILAKFTALAGDIRMPQEKAQELVGFYGEAATKYATDLQAHLAQRQWDTFTDTVKGWERDFRESPEFSNRTDTVLNDARWAIQELGGTDEQVKELRDILLASGTGNHPAVIRFAANAARRLKEARPGPRPAPTTSRPGDPADRRYGRSMTEEK